LDKSGGSGSVARAPASAESASNPPFLKLADSHWKRKKKKKRKKM